MKENIKMAEIIINLCQILNVVYERIYPEVLNHNLNFAPSSVLTELCWWLSFIAQIGTDYCGVNLPQDRATSRKKTGTDHNSTWQEIPVHISQLTHARRDITAGLRWSKSQHIIWNWLFQSDFFKNCSVGESSQYDYLMILKNVSLIQAIQMELLGQSLPKV